MGKNIDLNHRAADRDVERLPPRADDDSERRKIAPQPLDLGRSAKPRFPIELVPAVQEKNQPPVMRQQHEMPLA